MNTNEDIGINAEKQSLWSLLENNDIVIPSYQREYAYGRQTAEAQQIREAFIDVLINALEKNKPLELNFVYGAKVNNNECECFHLVDGQQRLTTLFALYWYVLMRAGKDYDRLKNFTYKTRTSSNTFFTEILRIKKEDIFDNESISGIKQRYKDCGDLQIRIREMPWFTGVMYSDPTVRSMLVVLDEIHSRFKNFAESDCTWEDLANRLIGETENSPVVFQGLDMGNALGGGEEAIQDLYIKMNSRGKLLTDFEIFKSLLGKKAEDDNPGKLDLLNRYFGKENDTNLNRINFISKFNSEYSDAFFQIVDDGKIIDNTGGAQIDESSKGSKKVQEFDRVMMNFVNQIFRTDYIVAAAKKKIPRKEYQPYYHKIAALNGKGLFSWIENHGRVDLTTAKGIIDNLIDADRILTDSLTKTDNLFSLIAKRNLTSERFGFFDNDDCFINEKALICDLKDESSSKLQLTVRSYGIFQFWNKYFVNDNLPTEGDDLYKAYKAWSRFVFNMTYNTDEDDLYKNVENACQECQFFDKLLDAIGENPTEGSVCNAISNQENADPAVRFKTQFGEEKIKASHMKDDNWKEAILAAEKRYIGSRIWPILELSKKDRDYDLAEFKRWRKVFEFLFDGDYKLNNNIDKELFEKALLCINDETNNGTGHLRQTDKNDMCSFLGDDYREILSKRVADNGEARHRIILSLIEELMDIKNYNEVENKLKEIISNHQEKIEVDWKKAFIENFDIINKRVEGFSFKDVITPDKNDFGDNNKNENESYTLLYSTSQRRTSCAELYSFILAYRLSEKGKAVTYTPAHYNDTFYDENHFPRRYLTIEDKKIGFCSGNLGRGFYTNKNEFLGSHVAEALKIFE